MPCAARAPGCYNPSLRADHGGERLKKLYRKMLVETEMLRELSPPVLATYAADRHPSEGFGDFVVCPSTVKATVRGLDFHD